MNSASASVDGSWWSSRRWRLVLASVFVLQLGLMLWLEDKRPIERRLPSAAPMLKLIPRGSELLSLNDPTLFALPHRESFSGAAWLRTRPPTFPPADWTEEPRWLNLSEAQLGAAFDQLSEPNLAFLSPTPPMPEPALSLPESVPVRPWRERSILRVDGGLARRPLLTSFQLPSWRHSELLTNTVVLVSVTAEGRPLSAVLLGRSGFQPADDWALEQTKAARFASLGDAPEILNQPLTHLNWGELVFEWLTLPPTNSLPAAE